MRVSRGRQSAESQICGKARETVSLSWLYVCRNLSSDANRYGAMCQGVPACRCVLTVTRNKRVTLSGGHLIHHQREKKTQTIAHCNVPVRRVGSFGHLRPF
ncbi:hypothetical protein E2C01_003711 [Portunus trituberculatus]|uniref:Uncharacterized protein n=1 Tax=Portunus trituberculatus TaxID=210409 RepID=A0A5B7CPH4_PORTR|nr:hypothetical protein [Portunus trituberculatus]